ncbi:hypothetical protein NEIRO03_0867 [Nematocida sp. AWRm78]|nr:hypothetical protein NEIRO02_1132 [Nematocida sp. AWRm79]KAI5183252.1 hypothetical protein NEIRO03_0867 [Nematocida sp. AWRm78]
MKLLYALKLLFMIDAMSARIELNEIMAIEEMVFDKEKDLVINPHGPLSPLRGYILYKGGYMYNKRLHAPEIDTMYTLKKTDKLTEYKDPIYEYIKKPANDIAYTDISIDKARNKYLVRFHTQLIKMFPCADGSLSIVAGRPDAITSFLTKKEVLPESMYILAALFLMSEQVDIPIIAEVKEEGQERLVLKSMDENRTYVDQSLVLYEDSTELKDEEKNYHTETAGVISFLRSYIGDRLMHPSTKSAFIEPTNYEQFLTGEFLNTPQFLLQSYIFEFIDTPKKYIEFVESVYTLLTDQIAHAELSTDKYPDSPSSSEMPTNRNLTLYKVKNSKKVLKKAFDRCFIDRQVGMARLELTAPIYKLKEWVDRFRTFPFNDSTQLPAYTRVQLYKRKDDEFEKEETKKYSNCVETALLGILCALAYNPMENIYTTDHIPTASADLQEFFKNYNTPLETTDQKMHQEWCRVVADLGKDCIVYKTENNEIVSGLVNILYVLSEITGNIPMVVEIVQFIESMCANEYLDNTNAIQEKISEVFKLLSKNPEVWIICDSLKLAKRSTKQTDIFGKITVYYSYKNTENGMFMDIRPGHAVLGIVANNDFNTGAIRSKLKKIEQVYSTLPNYMGYITKQYASIELAKIYHIEDEFGYIPKKQIRKYLSSENSNVLELFLLGKIYSLECKAFIIWSFFSSTASQSLPLTNPKVRFTKNIIGSTSLDDAATRQAVFGASVFNPRADEYYLTIEYMTQDYIKHDFDSEIVLYILKDVFTWSKYSEDVLIECFVNMLNSISYANRFSSFLKRYQIYRIILGFIKPEKYLLDRLAWIMDSVEKVSLENHETKHVDDIYIHWFIYSFDGYKADLNIIMKIYDKIDYSNLMPNYKLSINWGNYYFGILTFLNERKDKFCNENNPQSIKKYEGIKSIIESAVENSSRRSNSTE